MKYFKVVNLDYALNFDNKTFIQNLLHFIDTLKIGTATNYYIMGPYPDNGWTTKKGFLKGLEKKNFKNVIYFLISGDNFAVKFTNWLPNFETPPSTDVFELSFEIPVDKIPLEKLINISKQIITELTFDYGYGFETSELLGLSESNAKKTWFGLSGQTNAKETTWAQQSRQIELGKVKDIFTHNFLSVKHHQKILQKLSEINSSNITTFNNNLNHWTVSSEEIENYREMFLEQIIAERK